MFIRWLQVEVSTKSTPMKAIATIALLSCCVMPVLLQAQLTNGNINANFGVDADTRSNYVKYGPVTGAVPSDDWFLGGSGNYIIDTSSASSYALSLMAGNNISFNKRMSTLLYAKPGGKLWLDAAYGRDFTAASTAKDSTTFTIACKNGDNPTVWQGGVSSFPDKNDLIDVFAHMRRDGSNVHDSLWFFTGVSTFGTTGSSYFDVELYKKSLSYNPSTGLFATAGSDAGHTQWLFDAAGNITQTGDLIVAVNFSPGSVPVVDLRIWVSQSTLASVTPAYFNFTGSFNGATASPAFGYASIVSKAGTTAWGSGISNYSATPANDTTYSTPWGTANAAGTNNWNAFFQTEQFIEIGLNLTRIGVDPALYSTLNPCSSLFANIFFKSRSSNSFTSNMQDFMVPLVFLRDPVMDYAVQPDTLRCNHRTGRILITNNTTAGQYSWQTANGLISNSSSDSTQINITQPGTYIVSSSPAAGCPISRKDTVVIPIDTSRPVASINVSYVTGYSLPYFQFYGGNTAASNYATPFGGSKGLLWNWNGPNSFTSTIQNPATAGEYWGGYQLIVTEKRNGCTDTAYKLMNPADYTLLSDKRLVLNAVVEKEAITLRWQDYNPQATASYEIEKSLDNGIHFQSIGSVDNLFTFRDSDVQTGTIIYYRIKAIAKSGQLYYTAVLKIEANEANGLYRFIKTDAFGTTGTLSAMVNREIRAALTIYNSAGQLLRRENVHLYKGNNLIEVPLQQYQQKAMLILVLQDGNQVLFSQKITR